MNLAKYALELNSRSGYLKGKIASAEADNQKKSELMKRYYELNNKLNSVTQYSNNLVLLKKKVMAILDNRRNELIRNLEERVESILGVILPEENFKVKITYTANRNNFCTEVYVGKELANGTISWARPKGSNGEFVKQLVSFSMVASINILLNSNFLFMDEPFSSSDTTNVAKLQPVFDLMLSQNLQLLFIEHKRELYQNLPHNIIKLYKHRLPQAVPDGYVEVVNVERIEPDNDTETV